MDHPTGTGEAGGAAEVIETVVRRFEACDFKPDEFKHRHHLTVALWYLLTMDEASAFRRMREGLVRLISHYGLSGYNETTTLFWLKRASHALKTLDTRRPAAEVIAEAVELCGGSRTVFSYYSEERLSSDEAKAGWVGPDVRPLDF
jgi:hypothetical protein